MPKKLNELTAAPAPEMPAPALNLPALTPGAETSENALNKRMIKAAEIVGLVGTIAGIVGAALANPILAAVGGSLVAIAGYVGKGAVVGYTEARTELKVAALETKKAVDTIKATRPKK